MGNIKLKKSEIESAISNIKSLSTDLNEELSTICDSVDKVKDTWSDNLETYETITSILNSIRNVNKGYSELSNEYVRTLRNVVNNYENIDNDVSSKIATASVATMTLGASAFNNFDFSKVSNTAVNVVSGDFLGDGGFLRDVFTDGEYTINYLDNGVATINKNGAPMVFTTKENADKLIGGVTSSTATSSTASRSNAEQLVSGSASVNDIGKELNAKAMAKFASSGDPITKNPRISMTDGKKYTDTADKVVIPDELYTYDENGNVSLTSMHPVAAQKEKELIKACAEQGLDVKVLEEVRTVERQDSLYAQGRTAPGKRVTNARGETYSSNHQWGIAFDIGMNGNTAEEIYDAEQLQKVGEIGKALGLEWGGDWKICDMPHFQLPDYGSGTKEIKAQYGTPDKFADTWYQDK